MRPFPDAASITTGLTPTLLLVLWGGVLPGSLSAYILAAASWRAVIKPKPAEAPAEAESGTGEDKE